MVVTHPPFVTDFGDSGEDAWERLKWDRPDLVKGLLADSQARRENKSLDYGTPCTWYDSEFRRCRHYEYRPRACRSFEMGAEDCRDARRRADLKQR